MYRQVRGTVGEDPAMIISFMPFILEVSGYQVVEAMDEACGGIPIWGSITNSIGFDYETVFTICDGRAIRMGLAMMMLNEPVEPKFNDQPVLQYLKSVGLVITKENITTAPLMLYFDESSAPVAQGFYNIFEDGSILTASACGKAHL